MIPIASYWCCLDVGMRGFMAYVGTFYVPPNFRIPASNFELGWGGLVGVGHSAYFDWFVANYSLTLVFVDDGGDVPTPFYVLGEDFWSFFYIFIYTDAFACTDPCSFTSSPFNLPPY